MARRIYACFEDGPDGPISVALPRGGGDWEEVGAPDYKPRANDEIVVFVPGTEVTEHRAAIPARNEREARRAALFAIEDELASPVESLHIALSGKGEDGQRIVLVCSAERMTAWNNRLKREGWPVACLTPDYMALPATASAADTGLRLIFNLGTRRLALDGGAPGDLVSAVAGLSEGDPALHGAGIARRLGRTGEPLPGGTAAALATLAGGRQDFLDLRQGPFAQRQGMALPQVSLWQRAAGLAAAAGVVAIANVVLETRALNASADSHRAEAQALYAQYFPAEGRISNPATRVQQKLASQRATSLSFLDTSAVLYDAIGQLDGANLRSLRFDAETGEFRASVDYARYGDDLRLAELLGRAGLTATLGDTRSVGSGINGELRLEAGQ